METENLQPQAQQVDGLLPAGDYCCDDIERFTKDKEVPIAYVERFREFGILYQDGGSSKQRIDYCPWCGSKLPASLRDEWFVELDKLGIEPDDPGLPIHLRTSAWWKQR